MPRYDAMEDLVYNWVRRHAPHVTRDAVDAIIDGASDILRDSMADAFTPTQPINEVESGCHVQDYRPTTTGDSYALVEGR